MCCRRLQQEAARCALREATQERARGTHLGKDMMEGAEEEAWMAAVRLGNRRRAALEGAEQDVSPLLPMPSLCLLTAVGRIVQ